MENDFSYPVALVGLAAEYCKAIATARNSTPREFVEAMTRLLPRIYITMSDVNVDETDADVYMQQVLTEDDYTDARTALSRLMGENDSYLEVMKEGIQYSDTPIVAFVSEDLSDIYQYLFDFISNVSDAPDDIARSIFTQLVIDFRETWGKTLCNVLRVLNELRYSELLDIDDDI